MGDADSSVGMRGVARDIDADVVAAAHAICAATVLLQLAAVDSLCVRCGVSCCWVLSVGGARRVSSV